jgi:hypothetical protein
MPRWISEGQLKSWFDPDGLDTARMKQEQELRAAEAEI